MENFEHTEGCKQTHEEHLARRGAYISLWSNYCRTCCGAGNTCWTEDPSPAGISLSSGSLVFCDPCPDCLERGICPRCGQQVWDSNDFTGDPVACPECGWREESPDCLPPEPECRCWDRGGYWLGRMPDGKLKATQTEGGG